jgi:general secretion pathway protein J
MRRRPGPQRAAGPRTRRGGFTLLELLVAVSILALIAIIAWRGLSSLTRTRERLAPQNEAVHAVLAGFGQLERDLAQVPVNTNLFALPSQPVHLLSIDGHASLQILRLAESPDGSPASAVETVFYTVRDGALQRQYTAAQRYYSANPGSMLEAIALVPQIDDMRIRVWRNNVGWIAPASDADMANILGIEVVLVRHDGAALRRVFAIG